MIYKVVCEFNNLPDLINSLSNYNITFIDNNLYVSDVKCKDKSLFKNEIINLLKTDDYFIMEIDRNNLNKQSSHAMSWCEKQLAWSEIILFEEQKQETLKNTMKYLENIENFIFNGGENNAGTKEKKRKTP